MNNWVYYLSPWICQNTLLLSLAISLGFIPSFWFLLWPWASLRPIRFPIKNLPLIFLYNKWTRAANFLKVFYIWPQTQHCTTNQSITLSLAILFSYNPTQILLMPHHKTLRPPYSPSLSQLRKVTETFFLKTSIT